MFNLLFLKSSNRSRVCVSLWCARPSVDRDCLSIVVNMQRRLVWYVCRWWIGNILTICPKWISPESAIFIDFRASFQGLGVRRLAKIEGRRCPSSCERMCSSGWGFFVYLPN